MNSARTDVESHGHATRLVVQEHLVLASRLRLIEPLEEIDATLAFHAGFGQESVQSRVIDGDVTILRPKALGHPINAGDGNVTLIFNAKAGHPKPGLLQLIPWQSPPIAIANVARLARRHKIVALS